MNNGKYCKEITEEIAKDVREGSSKRDACILSGISEETFYKWYREKIEFTDALEKAELECKNRNIKIIQKAAITTWTAAAWLLERRYHKEYALKSQFDLGDNVVFPFTVIRPNANVRKAA